MHPRIRNTLLTGTALAALGAGLAVGCSKEYLVNPELIPTPTPESTYEIALKKLDSRTAEHWKGVVRDYNSEQSIDELYFIPEEGRLVMADNIEKYTADKIISNEELNEHG